MMPYYATAPTGGDKLCSDRTLGPPARSREPGQRTQKSHGCEWSRRQGLRHWFMARGPRWPRPEVATGATGRHWL